MQKKSLNTLIKVALLSAISYVLLYIEFPLLPFAPFLKMDFSEIPVLLAGFALSPLWGLCVEVMKFLLALTKPTQYVFIGPLANLVIYSCLLLPATIIYHKKKTFKGAVIGLSVGIVPAVIMACVMNYFLLLPAINITSENRIPLILTAIIPFNLIKTVVLNVIMMFLYKKISPFLKKMWF